MPGATFTTPADLLDDLNVRVARDVPLGPRTWFKCGGSAALLAQPSSTAQLAAVVERCNRKLVPMFVLGGGANLLVRDGGVDGVVVRLDDPTFKQLRLDGTRVTAGPGYDLFSLVTATARAGLDGLVHIAGIPGTVGGGVKMNCGGAFGDIGESVARVQLMSEEGQVYYRDRDDLTFDYRHTNIVAPLILDVEFDLTADDPAALMKRAKEIFLYKKNAQPMGDKSAGCTFKNPPEEVGATAGQLIDRAGLKTRAIGGASVSELHANFILAEPGCKADDVVALIEEVEAKVFQRFGVELEREVVIWG